MRSTKISHLTELNNQLNGKTSEQIRDFLQRHKMTLKKNEHVLAKSYVRQKFLVPDEHDEVDPLSA